MKKVTYGGVKKSVVFFILTSFNEPKPKNKNTDINNNVVIYHILNLQVVNLKILGIINTGVPTVVEFKILTI